MINCQNCNMQIIGATCADRLGLPICFDCWLSAKFSTDGKMSCPKCYGLGVYTQYYKPDNSPCEICGGTGRIRSADLIKVVLPPAGSTVLYTDDELPF